VKLANLQEAVLMDTTTPVFDKIRNDIREFFRKGRGMDIRIEEDPSNFGRKCVLAMSCRYWGQWEIPDGEEDDGDYDWEVLTSKSRKELYDFTQSMSKKHKNLLFEAGAEEKNWLNVIVMVK